VLKPDKILIRCERCKRETSLSQIYKNKAVCSSCGNATWHIQAIYLARQDDGDGTSLALKALGLGLLTSSGVSISSPLPGEKRPVNGFDIRDVPAEALVEIASPEVNPQIKLQAFVQLKRNEQFQRHREAMEQKGRQCEQCGVLYVISAEKPWTLLGTCSKVCCAAQLGVVDYALVEDQVLEQAKQHLPELSGRKREQQIVSVRCPACENQFELPRIYAGVHRKCPRCGEKVMVPQQ
jgi:DNA-directed RNA polymerase subunit RPC12/RpoP